MKSYWICSLCCIFLPHIVFLSVIHIIVGSCSLFYCYVVIHCTILPQLKPSFTDSDWVVSSLVYYEKCCYEYPCSRVWLSLTQWFSKCDLCISNIITWEFINAYSLVTSQTLLSWKLWRWGLAVWDLTSPLTYIKDWEPSWVSTQNWKWVIHIFNFTQ